MSVFKHYLQLWITQYGIGLGTRQMCDIGMKSDIGIGIALVFVNNNSSIFCFNISVGVFIKCYENILQT